MGAELSVEGSAARDEKIQSRRLEVKLSARAVLYFFYLMPRDKSSNRVSATENVVQVLDCSGAVFRVKRCSHDRDNDR